MKSLTYDKPSSDSWSNDQEDIRLIAELIKLLSRWHIELGEKSPVPKSIYGHHDSKASAKQQRVRNFYDSENKAHPRHKLSTRKPHRKEV